MAGRKKPAVAKAVPGTSSAANQRFKESNRRGRSRSNSVLAVASNKTPVKPTANTRNRPGTPKPAGASVKKNTKPSVQAAESSDTSIEDSAPQKAGGKPLTRAQREKSTESKGKSVPKANDKNSKIPKQSLVKNKGQLSGGDSRKQPGSAKKVMVVNESSDSDEDFQTSHLNSQKGTPTLKAGASFRVNLSQQLENVKDAPGAGSSKISTTSSPKRNSIIQPANDSDASSDAESPVKVPNQPGSGPVKKKTPQIHANVKEGANIVLKLRDEEILQLLAELEKLCPVAESKTAQARAEMIKWDEIAVGNLTGAECKRAWLFLMQTKKIRRNMWDYINQVKHSVQHDPSKYRMSVIESCPGFPEKPPGLQGGLNIYLHSKFAEFKDTPGNQRQGSYIEFYKEAAKNFQNLPQAEKQIWNDKSAKIQQKYEHDVQKFYKQFTGVLPQKKVKAKRIMGTGSSKSAKSKTVKIKLELYPDAPKLPPNPLDVFIQSKVEQDVPPSPEEYAELKAQYEIKWGKLKTSKKVKWIGKVIQQLETYHDSLKQYKETRPNYVEPRQNRFLYGVITKEELDLWAGAQGRPQEPPQSDKELFLRRLEEANEIPEGATDAEKKAIAEEKFKQLKWIEREKFNLELKSEVIAYVQQIGEYFLGLPEFLRNVLVKSVPSKYRHEIEGLAEVQPKTPKKRKKPISADFDDGNTPGTSTPKKSKKSPNVNTSARNLLEDVNKLNEAAVDDSGTTNIRKKKKKSKQTSDE